MSAEERFNKYVLITDWESCWLWIGFICRGYGVISVNNHPTQAHRFSYSIAYGPVPNGKILHHICRNPQCVNPRHLVAISKPNHSDSAPAQQSMKTHCPHGHEYTKGNTYLYTTVRNFKLTTQRLCKECNRTEVKNRTKRGKTNDRTSISS